MMCTHVMNMGLDWPNLRLAIILAALSTHRVRFVLRPEIVACTWDVDRPTLGLSNTTLSLGSYKGSFRVCPEACCKAWSIKMGFAPLYLREISLGPSSDRIQKCMPCYIWLRVNLVKGFQIIVSRKGGQLGARPNIVRQRERCVLYLVMVRPNDLYMRLGVGTSC